MKSRSYIDLKGVSDIYIVSFKIFCGELNSIITFSFLLSTRDDRRDATNSSFCPAIYGKITSSCSLNFHLFSTFFFFSCISLWQILEQHYYRSPSKSKEKVFLIAGLWKKATWSQLISFATAHFPTSELLPTAVSDGKCFTSGK